MSDPLSLVRAATMASTPITCVDGNYVFGNILLPETTKTNFRRTLKTNVYYYTLKDIIFFLENVDASVAEYRRKVVEARITAVVGQDGPALKSYLKGETDSCPQIDLAATSNFVVPEPAAVGQPSEAPAISSEKMKEQRERHAARLDKTIQKSKTATVAPTSSSSLKGLSSEKLEELRQLRRAQKRKTVQAFGSGGVVVSGAANEDEEVIDKEFLEADRQILAKLREDEQPSHTRSTVLDAVGMDFEFALKLFNEKVLKPKAVASGSRATVKAGTSQKSTVTQSTTNPETKSGSKHPTSTTATPASSSGVKPSSSGANVAHRSPIIIVPSARTSSITALNVKDLLIDGKYYSTEQKAAMGAKREREQVLTRTIFDGSRTRLLTYKVIDDPTRLSPQDWDRVVAVFATGQLWQFKGWRQPNPVELFQHVLGLHLAIDGRALDPTVVSWNCKVLKVNEFKQHLNASTASDFWTHLDAFVRLHKPFLDPMNSTVKRTAMPNPAQPRQQQHHHHHSRTPSSGKGVLAK